MFTPEAGSLRYSPHFGCFVELVRYVNDGKWFFKLVLPSPDLTKAARDLPDLGGIYRNKTPWSQMPLAKSPPWSKP